MNRRNPSTAASGSSAPVRHLDQRLPRSWQAWLARLRTAPFVSLHLIAGLALCALFLWAFIAIAEDIPEKGSLVHLDLTVAAWLQMHGTEWGEAIFSVISWLGSPVLIAIEIAVALWLLARRDWMRFWFWVATIGGGKLLELVLKLGFRRTRPVYASEFIHHQSWSFPSGHAMSSLIGYGLMAFLILPSVRGERRRRAIVIAAVALTAAIGYSRLYLGVHYLSDVVAGFLAGGLWLVICIWTFQATRRRATDRSPAA